MLYDKVYDAKRGNHYDLDHFDHIIDQHESTGYFINDKGETDVLFILLKNVISDDLIQLSQDCFGKFAKQYTRNRGMAGGVQENGKARFLHDGQSYSAQKMKSNVVGYYDNPLRTHKKLFKNNVVCRQTAFTLHKGDLWRRSYPFIQRVSSLYKQYGGQYYQNQQAEYDRILDELKIPQTVFSSITLNHNFRTATHVDANDFREGLGVLCFAGQFEGGMFGFPEYKVCINVQQGDILLCNVHESHCNTEIHEDDDRLSFVFYIRQSMSKCRTEHEMIQKYKYYVPTENV
jgi:hypothetical protein